MASPQRHEQIYKLFLEARELDAAARSAMLAEACADDPALREEVEALLAQQADMASFMEHAPVSGDEFPPDTGPETQSSAGEPLASGSSAADALAKITIEGYEILRELHRGGQGVVFQAIQKSTKRKVAIKVLREGPYASRGAQKRFEREIELVAQLKHPNIIAIFDSGTTADGWQYCAMDYVRGAQLHHHIHQNKLSLEDTLKIFAQVCNAVQYAHQKGVIHRDLKPSNILVDSDGNPKVLDFGLARQLIGPVQTVVSMTQDVIGTLPYMSPEQARGNPDHIDTRTDIYALGVILYEILTGHYPYPVAGQMVDVLRHIAETPPTPPSSQWTADSGVTERSSKHLRPGRCPIDDELQTVILKTLAKERERRYQSAGELGRDIGHFLAGEPIDAKRDSGWYVFKKAVGRHRAKVAVAGVFLAVILGCGFFVQHDRANRELGKRASGLCQEALNLHVRERHADARAKCDSALKLVPDMYEAIAVRAYALASEYLKQDYAFRDKMLLQDAQQSCVRAIQLEPGKKGVRNLLGMIRLHLGDPAGAIESLQAALRIEPKYHHALGNLAIALAIQGKYDKAIETAQHGAQIALNLNEWDEYDDQVVRILGTMQLYLGKEEALDSLTRAFAMDSRDFRNVLVLARLHLTLQGQQDDQEALRLAEDALAYTGLRDPRFKRTVAQAALRAGQYERAARYADAAAEEKDEPAYCYLIGAIAKARMGDKDGAKELLSKAQSHWPAAFKDGDVIVTAEKELLWFDTKAELEALREEAERLIAS